MPAFCRPPSAARLLPPAFCRPPSAALNATLVTLILCLALPGLAAPSLPTPAPPAASTLPAVPWDKGRQGGFVTALTGDRQGHVWTATEDDGVWEYSPSSPSGKQWTQFTAKNTNGGLGDDDIYSLTCDRLGRIWAGTGRSGVSVFNGKTWKTYDRLTGPLGCHVVALTTSPLTGDVWGCTDSGLFQYVLRTNTWRYFTRADGLPSDQATCLAFTHDGTLLVGTNCDGVVSASPTNGYRTWGGSVGPDVMPATLRGSGLPSSLINCLLVSRSGTVYAGTTTGLAKSGDGGDTWRFVRGADWRDKVLGLYHGPKPEAVAGEKGGLLEDYATSLAEDGSGRLYVSHRQKGLEVLDAATGARLDDPKAAYGGFVDALMPTRTGHVLIGTYGDGLQQASWAAPDVMATAAKMQASFPPLPLPAKPPTATQLTSMLTQVRALNGSLPAGGAAYLGEDWQTQGDEIGRYGRQYAVLCAMNHVMTCTNRYSVDGVIGPHHAPGDGIRWWVTWMRTDSPRSLYTPVAGVRRQAEWDDHAETVRREYMGPDIWVHLHLGEGDLHRVSLYFMNKDGHSGDNRIRDYVVEVKPYRASIDDADALPPLARARVRNFWGGVYECFLLRSPGDYYVKVSKNGSKNTILSGVFIDKVAGKATVEDGEALAYMNGVHYDPPAPSPPPRSARAVAAASLWAALDASYGSPDGADLQNPYRLLAYRALAASDAPAPLLAGWRWSLRLWTAGDRVGFDAAMAHGRSAGVKLAHARTPAEVAAASE